jgi:hypothetical protein
MFKIKLHPFYNLDGDIGDSSPSVEGADTAASTETASVQDETPAATPTETEGSFAKRLREHSEKAIRAEREKWEKEVSEKYKDYETHKELSAYFQEINGLDAMTLKERIELDRLQERAAKENLTPEVLKRIDMLEAKAAKADELEQQQQQQAERQKFETSLKEFCKDKGVDHMEMWQYMHENGVSRPDVALKAMKAEEFEKKAAAREEEVISKYLASKQAPKVEGSVGAAGIQSVDTSKMSWKELQRHTAARLEASKTPQ